MSSQNRNSKNKSKGPQHSNGNSRGVILKTQSAGSQLPYGFMPIDGCGIPRTPATDLGQTMKDRYSGYIQCKLYALNELCVGNSHSELGDDRTEITPLIVKDRYLISSNTLKGCIANFIAAYKGLPISRMNNHRYSFRPNNVPSGAAILSGAGIVESVDDGIYKIKKFTENTFAFVPYDNRSKKQFLGLTTDIAYTNQIFNKARGSVDAHKYIIGDKIDSRTPIEFIHTDSFMFYKYHDGIDGKGFFGSKAEHKSSHKSFGVRVTKGTEPDFDIERYIITAEKMKEYEQTIATLSDTDIGHLKNHPILTKHKLKDEDKSALSKKIIENSIVEEGSLIFFEYYEGTNEILTFGKHYRYRWAFKHDLHSFNEDYLPCDTSALQAGNLNITEELFGYCYEDVSIDYNRRAKSGKVHFSFAEHIPGTGGIPKEKWLPRPGEPKPSSFEFYLKQNYENSMNGKSTADLLCTYGDPARQDFNSRPRLSGRKFYYSTTKTSYNDNERESGVTKTIRLKNVLYPSNDSYPEFSFKVHYENLSMEELKLLKFALNLGDNTAPKQGSPFCNGLLCHQIGYGKNHGMGAVKITIDTDKDVEQIYSYGVSNNSITESVIEVDSSQFTEPGPLFRLHTSGKNYPIDVASKDKAVKKHNNKREVDDDSDGVGTYSWHTRLKNEDLANRRNTKRIK